MFPERARNATPHTARGLREAAADGLLHHQETRERERKKEREKERERERERERKRKRERKEERRRRGRRRRTNDKVSGCPNVCAPR